MIELAGAVGAEGRGVGGAAGVAGVVASGAGDGGDTMAAKTAGWRKEKPHKLVLVGLGMGPQIKSRTTPFEVPRNTP